MTNIFHISKNRYIDSNDFLYIKNNPIMRAGVFKYRLCDITDSKSEEIVNVLRPIEELEKIYENIANKPITLEHTWITTESNSDIVGSVGSDIRIDKEKGEIIADLLTIYNKGAIQDVINGIRDSLSAGFRQEVVKNDGVYNGMSYQYIQSILEFNHLALTAYPRDEKLKVFDTRKSKKESYMQKKSRLFSSFLNYAKLKGFKVNDSIDGQEDKIQEALKLIVKPDSDFEGGKDEKIIKLLEIAEGIKYDEADVLNEDIDKQAELDRLLEIAMSNEEDKLLKAYKTLAKIAHDDSKEEHTEDTEAQDDKEQEAQDNNNEIAKTLQALINEIKTLNERVTSVENSRQTDSEEEAKEQEAQDDSDEIEAIKEALKEEIKEEIKEEETEYNKALDSIKRVVGDFTPININGKRKTQKELYEYGLKVLQSKYDVKIGKVEDSKSAFIACSKFVDVLRSRASVAQLQSNNKIKSGIKVPGEIIKERS